MTTLPVIYTYLVTWNQIGKNIDDTMLQWLYSSSLFIFDLYTHVNYFTSVCFIECNESKYSSILEDALYMTK